MLVKMYMQTFAPLRLCFLFFFDQSVFYFVWCNFSPRLLIVDDFFFFITTKVTFALSHASLLKMQEQMPEMKKFTTDDGIWAELIAALRVSLFKYVKF